MICQPNDPHICSNRAMPSRRCFSVSSDGDDTDADDEGGDDADGGDRADGADGADDEGGDDADGVDNKSERNADGADDANDANAGADADPGRVGTNKYSETVVSKSSHYASDYKAPPGNGSSSSRCDAALIACSTPRRDSFC